MADALGDVRQLVDAEGTVNLVCEYEPFGDVLSQAGEATTSYGFTGEWTDNTGFVYLQARYYAPYTGRFISRDTWGGDSNQPMSYNDWLYGYANPVNQFDPSGMYPDGYGNGQCVICCEYERMLRSKRDLCLKEYGCSTGGIMPEDCDSLPGTAPSICKTYLALQDHPGWWSRDTWDGYRRFWR